MSTYRNLALAVTVILVGCVSFPRLEEVRAACAAQAYLQANGYLAPLKTFDPSMIDLELWDWMAYESDGAIDWPRLMADRQGRFPDKLFGVARGEDGYLAYYKIEGRFSCVSVSADLSIVDLHEANCRLQPLSTRLKERDLHCN